VVAVGVRGPRRLERRLLELHAHLECHDLLALKRLWAPSQRRGLDEHRLHPADQRDIHLYYGDNFKIECPTGSGKMMNLFEVAREIADRLARTFLRDPATGRRPVYGGTETFQTDPHWRDHLLFFEYFHGDNGAGLGASHQTGWTGVVTKTVQLFGLLDSERAIQVGKQAVTVRGARRHRGRLRPSRERRNRTALRHQE
jgi:hypothetical protein